MVKVGVKARVGVMVKVGVKARVGLRQGLGLGVPPRKLPSEPSRPSWLLLGLGLGLGFE